MYGNFIFQHRKNAFRPGRIFFGSVFVFVVLLTSLFPPVSLLYAQQLIPPLKRDDFNQIHDWWEYHRDGIPKSDSEALHNGKGFLRLNLRNPVFGKEFNIGISEFQNIYSKKQTYLCVEARIKLLTPLMPGSRGWGFWKSNKGQTHQSLAWFMQQKDVQSKKRSWSLVGTVVGKRRKVKPWHPDIGVWHVYRIERDLRQKTTRFWVDGKLFLSTVGLAPKERLSFHLWMDNQVYSKKKGILRQQWKGNEAMVVDYVQIQTERNVAPQPQILNAHVLFYKNFNAILNGQNTYQVGTYPFTSKGDSVYLLLTVRAEDLRPYDVPDRLTVCLDRETAPLIQVDGEKLQAGTRTFFKKILLPKGKHHIRLQARATPLLYDLLVLDATGSTVTVNTQAVNGSDTRFNWNCTEETPYLLYAAVTAREAPGFDQIHRNNLLERQDEDFQLQLISPEGGTNKKMEFCGNKLFGDCKTRLLTGTMSSGTYALIVKKEGHPEIQRLFLVRWNK